MGWFELGQAALSAVGAGAAGGLFGGGSSGQSRNRMAYESNRQYDMARQAAQFSQKGWQASFDEQRHWNEVALAQDKARLALEQRASHQADRSLWQSDRAFQEQVDQFNRMMARDASKLQVAVKDAEAAGLHPLFALGQSQGYSGGGTIGNPGVSGAGVGGGTSFGITSGPSGWDLPSAPSGSSYSEGQSRAVGAVAALQGFVQAIKDAQDAKAVGEERALSMKERAANIRLREAQIRRMEMETEEILGAEGRGKARNPANGARSVYGVRVEQPNLADQLKPHYGDPYAEFRGAMAGVRDDTKDNWRKLRWPSLRQPFSKVQRAIEKAIKGVEESGRTVPAPGSVTHYDERLAP